MCVPKGAGIGTHASASRLQKPAGRPSSKTVVGTHDSRCRSGCVGARPGPGLSTEPPVLNTGTAYLKETEQF